MGTRIVPRAVTPVAAGTIGAAAVLAGSAGAGWIGPTSNVRNLAIIEWARRDELTQSWCSFVVIVGGLVLVGAWLRLGAVLRQSSDRPAAVRTVVAAALAWAAPLTFAVPLYSRDLFAYVGQGRLVLNDINPYVEGIAAERGWYGIGVDPMWANTKTPYGPIFLWIEKVVVGAAGDSPVIAVAVFRVLAILGVIALAFFAYRISVLRGSDPVKVLWLVAASPVTLFNFVVGGHNDALMLALTLAAIYYALIKHPILAVVLVAAAVGVKPIAIIALPVVGILWAGAEAVLAVVIRYWVFAALIAFGVLGIIGLAINVGFGWVPALATPGSVSHWYAPVNILSSFIGWLFRIVGLDGDLVKSLIRGAALALMAVIVAWSMLTKKIVDPLMRLAIAFAAAVLLSPFIHPWYAAWVIVLFGIVDVREGTRTHLIVAASVFFAWVSIAEGMDTSRSVDGNSWPVVVRGVLIVSGIIGLALYFCRERGITAKLVVARVRTFQAWRRARAAAR